MRIPPAKPNRSLVDALRQEADSSEKGLDFMDDEDLANETRVQIGMLRDAADVIEKDEERLSDLRGALVQARDNVVDLARAGFDSTRGEIALRALKDIDRSLGNV